MPTIENHEIRVELDARWPRTVRLTRVENGASVAGCAPERPFALELNGRRIEQDEMFCTVEAGRCSADYLVAVLSLDLLLRFRFALDGADLVLTLPDVVERGAFRLEKLYVPDHRLVTGRAAGGDSYLRHVTRRTNWSRHWCPGTYYYDQWEDAGEVGGAQPEPGPQRCLYACVWNSGVCVGVICSIYVEPLVTSLDAAGGVLDGRAGEFSIWAGVYSHRLRGKPARPFEFRIGVLGDTNGNGKIDWCDAAAWEADRLPTPDPMYRETLIYKIFCDVRDAPAPAHTFADCLGVIRRLHAISGGLKQIVHLVGWQGVGHDSGFPCHTVINERVGGREGLVRLIEEARAYNCVVGLHANVDDSYAHNPEYREDLLSRGPDGRPLAWFNNPGAGGGVCYSINHTLSVESGYEQDRCDRLCAMLPLRESIHFDAFRCCNEVWEADGTHIDAECEVQRGMLPIIEIYRRKGLDVSAEGNLEEGREFLSWIWLLPRWQTGYQTVVTHGRLLGFWRTSLSRARGQREKQALGEFCCYPERGASYAETVKCFYLDWMYSQIMARKRIVQYWTGDWNNGVRAWYEDDTWCVGGPTPHGMEAGYEGIPIARGTDRFLPWRQDVIYAYSETGGPQEWTLPAAWAGGTVSAQMLRESGPVAGPGFSVEGRTIGFQAPAGVPIRLTKVAEPSSRTSRRS